MRACEARACGTGTAVPAVWFGELTRLCALPHQVVLSPDLVTTALHGRIRDDVGMIGDNQGAP